MHRIDVVAPAYRIITREIGGALGPDAIAGVSHAGREEAAYVGFHGHFLGVLSAPTISTINAITVADATSHPAASRGSSVPSHVIGAGPGAASNASVPRDRKNDRRGLRHPNKDVRNSKDATKFRP